MATRETDHLDDLGHWLSRENRTQLARLSDQIKCLAREMKAPAEGESQEDVPGMPTDEWVGRLEALAEQLDGVLLPSQVSSPARRETATDAEDESVGTVVSETIYAHADRYVVGVTLDQVDAFDRLIQAMAAQGDVVASSDTTELATHTLPVLGHAICEAADAARGLLDRVETQRLGAAPRVRHGMGETRGVYGAALATPTGAGLSGYVTLPLLYRLREEPAESCGGSLH